MSVVDHVSEKLGKEKHSISSAFPNLLLILSFLLVTGSNKILLFLLLLLFFQALYRSLEFSEVCTARHPHGTDKGLWQSISILGRNFPWEVSVGWLWLMLLVKDKVTLVFSTELALQVWSWHELGLSCQDAEDGKHLCSPSTLTACFWNREVKNVLKTVICLCFSCL